MRPSPLLLMCALPLLAACDGATPVAPAVPTTVTSPARLDSKVVVIRELKMPVDGVLDGVCSNESIQITGTESITERILYHDDGSAHLTLHVNGADLHGTGLDTGTRYSIMVALNETVQADLTAGTERAQETLTERFTATGPHNPDFMVQQVYWVTYDGSVYLDGYRHLSSGCK